MLSLYLSHRLGRLCVLLVSILFSLVKSCFFLYPYETTRDQGIPHDIKIMHELWNVERYQTTNQFCATAGIITLIEALPAGPEQDELRASVVRITESYDSLSDKYHTEKAAKPKNDIAFN